MRKRMRIRRGERAADCRCSEQCMRMRRARNGCMHQHWTQDCSSSTSTPWQSFGCTNMTGFPCAPFDGFSDSRRTPRARRSFTAFSMSSTCASVNYCVAIAIRLGVRRWAGKVPSLSSGTWDTRTRNAVHERYREHTSMHTWWRPPAGFFCRKPAIGLFAPNGCSSYKHNYGTILIQRMYYTSTVS